MTKSTSCLRTVFDLFFLGFGLWTVYCNVLVLSGRSFNELARWSFVPLVLLLTAALYWRRALAPGSAGVQSGQVEARAETPGVRDAGRFMLLGIAGAAATVGLYGAMETTGATESFVVWWLLSLAFVVVAMWRTPAQREIPARAIAATEAPTPSWIVLLLLSLAGLFLFAFYVPSPNWEASFYLSMGTSSAEFPDRPLLRTDWLHGEPDLPPLGFYYLASSQELLIATLSRFTGVVQADLFYEVFPRVALLMSIVAHWLALRQFGIRRRPAVLGLLLAVLVWTSWGGPMRALCSWAFSGAMTGKVMLVLLGVPAIYYAAARYREEGSSLSWAVFACAVISAVGFSSSGIVVGPLAAGCVVLSRWKNDRDALLRSAWGFAPILYPALVGVAVMMIQSAETSANSWQQVGSRVLQESHTAAEGFRLVLGWRGGGPRPYLALFSLLAISVLPIERRTHQRCLQALVLAILLLVVNPFAPIALSQLAENMWWRAYWSVPFPLLIGLAGAMIVSIPKHVTWAAPIPLVVFGSLCLSFALAPQPWAVTRLNLGLPWVKSGPYYGDRHLEAAKAVRHHFVPSALVLAPHRVAMKLIAFGEHPRLVAVRVAYVKPIFSPLGKKEIMVRRKLQTWMDFDKPNPSQSGQARFLAREIDRLGISGVVLKTGSVLHRQFRRTLKRRGFAKLQTVGGYVLWGARPS